MFITHTTILPFLSKFYPKTFLHYVEMKTRFHRKKYPKTLTQGKLAHVYTSFESIGVVE